MSDLIEEYGYILISAICAAVLIAAFTTGLDHDGFIGKTVVDFAHSIIGG